MATLIGLFMLGRDAELRNTANGDQVASLALAYNYGRKGQDGKQPTQWVEAALWGERAGKLTEYLTKGSQFFMHVDNLHIETYDKRDGGQGFKLAGRVANVEFTRGGRPDVGAPRQSAPAPRQAAPQRQAPAPSQSSGSGFDDMSDIPF